ncbi:nuclear transport factor 2 family protein [Vibrio penaeicida]|uniref:nuclear transport factor 2 family protein n=1 Tax=Vibrio penaeicida TaxID=104609 RepID=UPI00273676C1|nr:nuclear transport factor 2 family protein [Vibrio penaeicida]MDP2571909.1 nuclear transport factor 2 family protein [Vibrio penaeicida]
MNATDLIKNLYSSVDSKDVEHLSTFLADDVRFRIGNFDPVIGKTAVVEANQTFFASISSMAHQIDSIWSKGNDVICHGSVEYIRLDGSTHSAVFATILHVSNNKIKDYLVYADLSQL